MQTLSTRSAIERILTIMAELGNERGVTIGELARRFEVSTKTIRRDREFIQDRLLVEIEMDGAFRYRARNQDQVKAITRALKPAIPRRQS